MRKVRPPDISGKLSPASIHSIAHTKKVTLFFLKKVTFLMLCKEDYDGAMYKKFL